MRSTIADTGYGSPDAVGILCRCRRVFFGLVLLFPCYITTITLFQRVTDPGFAGHFWKTEAFLYFAVGFVLHGGWFLTRLFQPLFLYLYVLGHELTHAVFVYLCFGRVTGFSVGLDGGHVVTNKSNIVIALSPYFIPFWAAVVVVLMTVTGLLVDLPHHDRILFGLIGATWSFHLFWTLWIIPRDQPDLKENGTFFSLTVIYLVNVVLISVLVCMAFRDLSWRDFIYNWVNNLMDSGGRILGGLESLFERRP